MKTPTASSTKRPITVTVSGDRNSGKTTLIAVVAHALENSNHRVHKPDHVPNAFAAIADLHEQFDITFVEDNGDGAVPYVFAAREEVLKEEIARLTAEVGRLHAEAVSLSRPSPEQLDDEIDKAFAEARTAAELGIQLRNVQRQQNELRFKSLELMRGRDGNLDKARDRLRRAFGYVTPPAPPIRYIHEERLPAEARLLAANEALMGAEHEEGC
jgi:hypothetical protein